MGYRAHIVKEYKVKFAEGGFYNHQVSEFGEFLRLETLSLCPFEISCLDLKLLNEEEKAWLNAYHDKVFKALNKHLSAKALKWLKEKTQKI